MNQEFETATFANGCFWCSEAVFQRLRGVIKVQSGYSGGHVPNPTYEQVCNGDTGHAESLQITFDPKLISYQKLLEVFWTTHDPTSLNRQGNDIGTQYRSVIFYHDENQKRLAAESKEKLNEGGIYDRPIVTAIKPLTNFYPAEDMHDNYYNLHPLQPYCFYVVKPKIEKLKKYFKEEIREVSK
ncbi:MAG: peptide-methionine (S)-S-oxide reductase MsrA [Chitinophagaceae bacterium]|nr:peptide-methionine (S)-S-oxide reductase MsrA [Chitinophagaceae bacterium]